LKILLFIIRFSYGLGRKPYAVLKKRDFYFAGILPYHVEEELKKQVDAKASPIDVIDYFKRRVKELKGFYPEIDYGKDGRLAKERLKKYSFDEVRDLIDWYLNSEHFEKFGASLSICLSNFIVNLWKASKAGQRSINNLYPLWQERS